MTQLMVFLFVGLFDNKIGAAVHGPRIQADRDIYQSAIVSLLQQTPNLDIVQGSADAFLFNENGLFLFFFYFQVNQFIQRRILKTIFVFISLK